MSKAFGYARVSSDHSAQSELSIEAQKIAIKSYAEKQGLTLASSSFPGNEEPGFYTDLAQSAWKTKLYNRPGGGKLRFDCRRGDHIIFYSIDRGFRSVLDFSCTVKNLYDQGIIVHLVSERFNLNTANGTLMANILAAFAQWKSDMLSERLKEAFAAKRARGGKPHKKPEFHAPNVDNRVLRYYNELMEEDHERKKYFGTVYTYARASHLDSVKSGLGLEAQEEKTRRFAERISGELKCGLGKHFCDEAVSGFKVPFAERPQGGKLNSTLVPGDHIVFSRIDRAWRSTKDMVLSVEKWREMGVSLHFADLGISSDTAMGNVFLGTMCTLAQWESEFISERTKAALAVARAQGRMTTGSIPRETKVIKHQGKKYVILDQSKAKDFWFVWHLRENHKLSFPKISDHMEKIDAWKEGREPIPLSGVFNRDRSVGVRSNKDDILQVRRWGVMACRRAHKTWPRMAEMLRMAKERGESLTEYEPSRDNNPAQK